MYSYPRLLEHSAGLTAHDAFVPFLIRRIASSKVVYVLRSIVVESEHPQWSYMRVDRPNSMEDGVSLELQASSIVLARNRPPSS